MFPEFKRTNLATVIMVTIVALIYCILGTSVFTAEGMFAGDAGVKLLQIKAFTLSGYRDPAIEYPAINIDPSQTYSPLRQAFSSPFTFGNETKRYGVFSEAFALLGAVLYQSAGYRGLQILPVVFGIGVIVVAALSAVSLGTRGSWAVPVIVGLCTPLIHYSFAFSEHVVATFLADLSVILTAYGLSLERRNVPFVMSGLSLALSLSFRSELYVMCVAMPIAVVLTVRSFKASARILSLFWIGFLLCLMPLWGWNYVRSGHLLGAHVAYGGTPSLRYLPWQQRLHTQLGTFAMFLAPAGQKKWLLLLAIVGIIALIERYRRRSMSSTAKGAAGVWPLVVLLLGYSLITLVHIVGGYVPHISFFDVSPVAALVLLSLLPITRQSLHMDKALTFLAWTATLFVTAVAAVAPTWGGGGWGPRMLLPAYPIVSVMVCHILLGLKAKPFSGLQRISLVTVSVLLIISSLTIQMLGLMRQHNDRQYLAGILDTTESLDPSVSVTNTGIFWKLVAPIWEDIHVFGVLSVEELTELVQLLAENNVESFWWVSSRYDLWRRGNADPNPIVQHEGREIGLAYTVEQEGSTYTFCRNPIVQHEGIDPWLGFGVGQEELTYTLYRIIPVSEMTNTEQNLD